jgi:hypothetical protein
VEDDRHPDERFVVVDQGIHVDLEPGRFAPGPTPLDVLDPQRVPLDLGLLHIGPQLDRAV